MIDPPAPPVPPGKLLARGVCRHLISLDFMPMTEHVPETGLRVDVIALGPKGEIWIIECKSSRADYLSDRKWQGYLPWCDRFFWAVDQDFPLELLPEEEGIILADGYGAAIMREAPERRLAPARRHAVLRGFARTAALRLQGLRDPGVRAGPAGGAAAEAEGRNGPLRPPD